MNRKAVVPLVIWAIVGLFVVTGSLFAARKLGFNIIPDSATLTNDCISGPIIIEGTDGDANGLHFNCPSNVDYCKVTAEATWEKPIGDYGVVFERLNCDSSYSQSECFIKIDTDGDGTLDLLKRDYLQVSTSRTLAGIRYPFSDDFGHPITKNHLNLAQIYTSSKPGSMTFIAFRPPRNGLTDYEKVLLNQTSGIDTYGGNYQIGGYFNLCKSWDANYGECGITTPYTAQNKFTKSIDIEMQAGDSINFQPKNIDGTLISPSNYQLRVLKYNDCTGSCSYGQKKCVVLNKNTHYSTKQQCLDAGCPESQVRHYYTYYYCYIPDSDKNSYYIPCTSQNEKGCNIFGGGQKCPTGQKCYSDGELKAGLGGCMCDPSDCVLGTTKQGSLPNRYFLCESYGSCTRWSSEKTCDGQMVYDEKARGGKGDCVCPTTNICESENQAWCENLQQLRGCTRYDWTAIDSTKICILKNNDVENQPDDLVQCSQDGKYASWKCVLQEGCISTTAKRCNGNEFEICSCKEIPGSGTICPGTNTEGCLHWIPAGIKNQCCVEDSDCNNGDPSYTSSCDQVTHECKFTRKEGYCSIDSDCTEYEHCQNNVCVARNTGIYCDASEKGNTRCDPDDADSVKIQRCQKLINTNAYKWVEVTSCPSVSYNPGTYKCSYQSPQVSSCTCINEPECTQGSYVCDGNILKLCTKDTNGCVYLKDLGLKTKGCCISSKDECSAQNGYTSSCNTNVHECQYTPIADYCSTANPCISPYVCDFSTHHCKVPPVDSIYCSQSLSGSTSCRTEPNYQYICEFNSDLTHGEMGDIYTWQKTECTYPQQCFNTKCACPVSSDYCVSGSAPVCTSDEKSKKECIGSVGICSKWQVIPCIGDQRCKDGVCVCPSEADNPKYCDVAGDDKCSDDLHDTLICQNVNGCLQWVIQETCGEGQICVKHSPAKCTYPIDDIVVIPKPAYAVGEPINNISVIATSQQFQGQTLYVSGVLFGTSEIRKDTFTNVEGKGSLDFGNDSGIEKVGTFPLLIQVCNQAPTYDHTEICQTKNASIIVKKTLEIRLNSPFSTIKNRVCSVSYQVVDKATPSTVIGVTPTISVMQGSTIIPYTIEGTNTIQFTPRNVGNVVLKLGAEKIDYISDSAEVTIEVTNPTRTSTVKVDNTDIYKVTGLLPTGIHTITVKVDKSGDILELYAPQLKMETPTGQVLDLVWMEQKDKSWKTDYNFLEPGKTYVLSGALTFKDLSEASESVSYTIATKGVQTGGQKTSGSWATMGIIAFASIALLITAIILLVRRKK